jgi:hypothetical protein
MRVTTQYVQVGDGAVVEFVTTYGGSDTIDVKVNVLPAVSSPASEPDTVGPGSALVAAPLEMCAADPMPTKKKRGLMGAIRGAWFIIFTFAGEAVQYGIDNLAGINLPPKTGMVVGASLYAAKRAIWPNSTI